MSRQIFNFITFAVIASICIRNGNGKLFGRSNMTTPILIEEAGYPVKKYEVTTEDGYILTLHRIPCSPKRKNCTRKNPLPVVFLQHGLTGSSIDWIGLGPSKALGYLLSDEGFDVWMGNSRGNEYSQKHKQKNTASSFYWDFSWHEMGIYDLPASFRFINSKTGVKQFTYIGYSQGTTEFLVYCSSNSRCKKIIKGAHMLAPVAFTKNFRDSLAKLVAPHLGFLDTLSKAIGSVNISGILKIIHRLVKKFACLLPGDCELLDSFLGSNEFFNKTMLSFLMEAYPASASFKQVLHYLQSHNSGKFRQFDYGCLNKHVYGSLEPPDYNLANISTPMYLYYAEGDSKATYEDIETLIKALPGGVVKQKYGVPPKKFSHIHFIYGTKVKELLYDEIIKNVKKNYLQ